MSPAWIRITRRFRTRQLRCKQRIVSVELENAGILQDAVAAGHGVLLTPNHSAHYDAPALYLAADSISQPLFFMTAWQVFAMSTRWEQWAMQRLGCFSVDREGTDRQAIRQAIETLRGEPYPLVIFPEGDIYHTTDHVTLFRDGAAAVALAAARKSQRPIVAIPCGIRFRYVDHPIEELEKALTALEERLYLRTDSSRPVAERIHRMAEAALALKELDYLGHTRTGRLRERVGDLAEHVILQLEKRHDLRSGRSAIPERVKTVRSKVIQCIEEAETQGDSLDLLSQEMDDLFFVMQLYSYRGDYLVDNPSFERLAETVDKFEEDILGLDYPNVRGHREVVIRLGEPLRVERQGTRDEATELTQTLQTRVQCLVDQLKTTRSHNEDRSGTMP